MKKQLVVGLAIVFMVTGMASTAETGLYLRGQGTSTHGTYNLIYDDYFDITWYDFSIRIEDEGSSPDWSWGSALTWADNLSVDFYGATHEDWRLPDPYNHDGSGPIHYDPDSELGHLYSETHTGSPHPVSSIGFVSGPWYWTGVEESGVYAWASYLYNNTQWGYLKDRDYFWACAVRPGDVGNASLEITCNGVDENLNGMADDAPDSDTDTYDVCNPADPGDTDGLAADCNDGDGSINPGATDANCDGIDQDCSGADNCPCSDIDGDGYGDPGDDTCPNGPETDCNDGDDTINPGATDVYCDGIDQDCSGTDNCPCSDIDGDDYGDPGDDTCPNGAETDCNDGDDTINPGATDVYCDGIDQDCSGVDNCDRVNLPRTGQTTCYDSAGTVIPCSDTGQDGDIRVGVKWPPSRFTDNGDGTVTDHLTGLMWLKDASCLGHGEWPDALDAVADLSVNPGNYSCADYVANHDDWRLPNIVELESLVNTEEPSPAAWLNTQGFTNVQGSNFSDYWSGTTIHYYMTKAWYVNMRRGHVFYGSKNVWSSPHIWPVRGGQAAPAQTWQTNQTTVYEPGDDGDIQAGAEWHSPRFVDNGDGTVTDNLTGLVWLKDADRFGQPNWLEALDACNTLSDDGTTLTDGSVAGDWRLPNRKELFSLIDFVCFTPALSNTAGTGEWSEGDPFTNVQHHSKYWSATTIAENPSSAWVVSMLEGSVGYGSVYGDGRKSSTSLYYVWPVRAGQSGLFCADYDGDGYGDPGNDTCPNGAETDCNDGDDTIYPGATDVYCDGIDQDCSGADNCPCTDTDGDGYGVCPDCGIVKDCTYDGDDCNDGDDTINPGATDVPCDGIDQDCSGPDAFGTDVDGDMYKTEGGLCGAVDCNDGDDTINPGATDVPCDGIDQDCSGADAFGTDVDGDTYKTEGGLCGAVDCNDGDNSVYPGATEIVCDGIDQDCSGADNCPCTDTDGDGYGVCPDCGIVKDCTYDGDDCNDGDDTINPGAIDVLCDGIDQDCSGADAVGTDVDGDTFKTEGGLCGAVDCNDGDDTIYPGATEIVCDGIDQDCSGADNCPCTGTAHSSGACGVNRSSADYSTGSCAHCHDTFDNSICGVNPLMLFSPNYSTSQTENFCFECHKDVGTLQDPAFNNYNYTQRVNGYTDTYFPTNILDAFSYIDETGNSVYNLGYDTGTSHKLTDIKNFLDGRWGYTGDSNPCTACHNPHTAQRDAHTAGSRGWPVSRPSGHALPSTWELWGDDPDERMNQYTTYQAPNAVSGYEPDGSTIQDGSNLTDYATLCTDCHNNSNTIYSNVLNRNLHKFDWNVEKHGLGDADDDDEDLTEVKVPYGDSTRHVLACTDCHEPHGTLNNFLIRPYVNNQWVRIKDYGTGYGPYPDSEENKEWSYLCGSCHGHLARGDGHLHYQDIDGDGLTDCEQCHGGGTYRICSACHYHGNTTTGGL